jgi:hypothetical protein
MTNAMMANAKIPPIMAPTMIPIFAFGTRCGGEAGPACSIERPGFPGLYLQNPHIHISRHNFWELGSQFHSSIWFASLEMKHNF